MDWQVEYDSVLEWCLDAEKKVEKLRKPGEYMVLVERQHNEIEVSNGRLSGCCARIIFQKKNWRNIGGLHSK